MNETNIFILVEKVGCFDNTDTYIVGAYKKLSNAETVKNNLLSEYAHKDYYIEETTLYYEGLA